MTMFLSNKSALPANSYEGAKHGPSTVSTILSESDPGCGPRLPCHPYDETWIVQEGWVQLWIGEETAEVTARDIAVATPNTPHKFKNIGDDVARLICIYANHAITGEWLE